MKLPRPPWRYKCVFVMSQNRGGNRTRFSGKAARCPTRATRMQS